MRGAVVTELQPYQQRVPVREIRAGDFLDLLEGFKYQGPRGGRYFMRGTRVESRVESVSRERGRLVLKTRAYPALTVHPESEFRGTAVIRRES